MGPVPLAPLKRWSPEEHTQIRGDWDLDWNWMWY